MFPTSLPGGSPGGITCARPTSPRLASCARRGIDAASSGVRPPSSSSATSAQPSGTNTRYFTATHRTATVVRLGARVACPPMRLRHAMCAVVVLALAGAACGGDDDNPNDAANSSPPTSTEPTTAPSSGTTATTATNAVPDLGAVKVKFTQLVSGLDQPVDFAVRKGDDRAYYIAEQHVGRVVRLVGNKVTGAPVLDIGRDVTQA